MDDNNANIIVDLRRTMSLYLSLYHLHTFIRKLRLVGSSPYSAAAVAAPARQIPDFIAEALVGAPIATVVKRQTSPFTRIRPRLSCRRRSSCHCTGKKPSHILIVNSNVDRSRRFPKRVSRNRSRRRRRWRVQVLQLRQNWWVLGFLLHGALNASLDTHCHGG